MEGGIEEEEMEVGKEVILNVNTNKKEKGEESSERGIGVIIKNGKISSLLLLSSSPSSSSPFFSIKPFLLLFQTFIYLLVYWDQNYPIIIKIIIIIII